MKRHIFTFVTVLLMAATLSLLSPPALAAQTHQVSTLEGLKTALSKAANGDVIEVGANIELDNGLYFDKVGVTVTIKGGGKTIKAGGGSYLNGMIQITGGIIVLENITLDCASKGGGIKVYAYKQEGNGDASLEMKNGAKITGGANGWGGGVSITGDGTFTMRDGSEVSNNIAPGGTSASRGGGVYVQNGTFNMYGGKITGNTAGQTANGSFGGGVHIFNSTFNMTGGEISNNSCYMDGGGVYVNGSTVNMSGGETKGNNAERYGEGVYNTNSTFNMSGGTISEVSTGYDVNGVYGNGTFNITGGAIKGGARVTGPFKIGASVNPIKIDTYYISSANTTIEVEGKPADGSEIGVSGSPTYGIPLCVVRGAAISVNSAFFSAMVKLVNTDAARIELKGSEIWLCFDGAQQPRITKQPEKITYYYDPVTYEFVNPKPMIVEAAADDGGTLSYQWYNNEWNGNTYTGKPVSGATQASFIPKALGDYYYYVVVTNTINGKTSSVSSSLARPNIREYDPSNPNIPNPSPSPGPSGGDPSGPTTIPGTISLTDAAAPHINLATETVNVPFAVAAYSVDGGKRWKKGPLPTDKKLTKLFDKGLTLWVASKYNDKDIKDGKQVKEKKGVSSTATVVMFPAIEKRPKGNTEKLAPFYWSENPDTWVLCKKGTTVYTAPAEAYEWAETSDGKTPKGPWEKMSPLSTAENSDHSEDGFKLKQPGEKVTYLFRSAATAVSDTYIPAGKVFKVKPAAYLKVPAYKVPAVKKGTAVLKLKKGDFCKVGDKGYGSLTTATTLNIVYEIKDAETELLGGSQVTIWKAATGKKPRSIEQSNLTMPTIPKPEAET